MKENLKKIVLSVLVLTTLFVFFSCDKNKKNDKKVEWNSEDGKIAILYGYGYNDEEFVNTSLENLSKKFSVETEEDPGMIIHFVFPDDFYVSGTSLTRISFLSSYLEDVNCKALITLGAPEFTHRSLAKIRDANQENPCFIVSLFSQDDVLSTEAESNVVIDFVEKEKEKDEGEIDVSEEDTMQHIEKTHYILEKMVNAIVGKNDFEDNSAQSVIVNLYGNDWEVGSYVDSSTGLKSRNHFVLKYIEKPIVPEKKKKGKSSK